MNTYEQLLSQFNIKQEDRKIDQKTQLQYQQLLNSIKSQKNKKKTIKNKLSLERYTLQNVNKHQVRKRTTQQLSLNKSNSQQQKSILFQSRLTTTTSTITINTQLLTNNTIFQQKKAMIQMQKQSLMQQIDNLIKIIDNLKQQKTLTKQQLKILSIKQNQMTILVNQSINQIQMLYTKIKQLKQKNDNNYQYYKQHIDKLTKKIQHINEQNKQLSTKYKQLTNTNIQKTHNNFIGHLLQWKNQQNKLKRFQTKIYTKSKLQQMLKSLFIIVTLANCNYGNIIQHLIKIAQSKKRIRFSNSNRLSSKNNSNRLVVVSSKDNSNIKGDDIISSDDNNYEFYLDSYGEQLPINQLIQKIQSNLLTPAQVRLLSKHQIISYYANKHGIVISSSSQQQKVNLKNNNNNNININLSQQTQSIIQTISQHYQKITSWFSRIQKRNQQLSQYYQSLLKIDDQLSKQIKTIQSTSQQKSITYLQSRQGQIYKLQQNLHQQCKVIFQFNINMYDLIKRFQNLNKFFDQIVKKVDKFNKYKKTYVENQQDAMFLRNITKTLFKSPQSIVMDWNKVIKNNKNISTNSNSRSGNNNNFLTSTSSSSMSMSISISINNNKTNINNFSQFQQSTQNQIYYQTIMKNDLLRIYAQPSLYDSKKSYIDNLQTTFNYVIQQQIQIVQKLASILKDLLIFSKHGIEEQQSKKNIMSQKCFKQYQPKRQQSHNNYYLNNNNVIINNDHDNKRGQSSLTSSQITTKNTSLNSLLTLLQQPGVDCKFDKFSKKDQIKQQTGWEICNNNNNNKQEQQKPMLNSFNNNNNNNNIIITQKDNFCVESNDYYRRDNFKIIQKLQKLNLKKRGLLPNVPFFNDTTLQLQPVQMKSTLNRTMTEKQPLRLGTTRNSYKNVRSPRMSHQLLTNRHNMLSQRRQRESTRKKDLKLLLANISNIASQNQRYRIKKKINYNQTMSNGSTSRINFSSSK